LDGVRPFVWLLVLLPLAAAGCGGGSKDTTTQAETQTGTQPPSKPEFVAVADTICHNHASRREDLESQANELGPLNAEKAHRVADLLRQASDNLTAEAQELQALHPPATGVGALRSLVSNISAQAGLIDRWADAYDALDTQEIRRLQLRIGVVAEKAQRTAQREGFRVCGQA
jgi:hypothetical protein